MGRRLIEWRIGPFVVAFLWPLFKRPRRAPKPFATPVLFPDEDTPTKPIKVILTAEDMPPP